MVTGCRINGIINYMYFDLERYRVFLHTGSLTFFLYIHTAVLLYIFPSNQYLSTHSMLVVHTLSVPVI